MDKVNIIEQVSKSGGFVFVGIGLLFILIAVVVGVFKQTWLIAGVNTMPKEKLAKMDLDYLGKYFGLFFGLFGGIVVISPFIFAYLSIMKYFPGFFMVATLGFCAFVILYFNVIKRKRIYNKHTGHIEAVPHQKDISSKNWRKIIPVAITIATTVAVLVMFYFSYKDPRIKFDSTAFKLKGVYGVNISFTEISKVDTIVWREMPAISRRTNGFSFSKVSRGYFRTSDGEKIHLSINRGISPVIRVVEQNGSVYYINRRNVSETRQIFNKLKTN
jgi:hypothetical protein